MAQINHISLCNKPYLKHFRSLFLSQRSTDRMSQASSLNWAAGSLHVRRYIILSNDGEYRRSPKLLVWTEAKKISTEKNTRP
jgi:hypothetical protein